MGKKENAGNHRLLSVSSVSGVKISFTSSHMKHEGGFAKGRLYLIYLIFLRGWLSGWVVEVYLAFSKAFVRVSYNIL